MPRNPTDVTEAELAVLRVLWERGTATIRELTEELYPGGGTSAYATVQKLLERLEDKACVVRQRAGVAHVFQARIDRDTLIGLRLRELADSLCDGSLSPLLSHLAHQKLTPKERESLRALVDELGKSRRRGD